MCGLRELALEGGEADGKERIWAVLEVTKLDFQIAERVVPEARASRCEGHCSACALAGCEA